MSLATNLYEGYSDKQVFGTPEYIAPEVRKQTLNFCAAKMRLRKQVLMSLIQAEDMRICNA